MIFPFSNVVESIGSGTDTDLYGFVLPKLKAIYIDEESDWLFAEAAYKYIYSKQILKLVFVSRILQKIRT